MLEGERRRALLAEALGAQVVDVGLLGVLAGLPDEEGEAARTALLSALQKVLSQGAALGQAAVVTDAVERALGGLLRAGEDGAARALRSEAWAVVQRTQAPGARERLALTGWPPFPPALGARDLTLLDRP